MSELALFKSGELLPDYLREGTDDMTKRLAGSAGGKSISTEGGVFRMIVGGDEIAKNEDRAMNIVIVAAAKDISRAFYTGKYVKGESNGPVCASGDGKTPDENSSSPQSTSCATCPQNIAGSGDDGSRACRFNQRFAVLLENDLSGNVYRLQLPATSIFGKPENNKMAMQAYCKFLSGHGVPLSGIVTEARFDTSKAVAVLKFNAVRPLSREELTIARTQGGTDDAAQAIEFKLAAPKEEAAPTTALPAAFAKPAEAPARTPKVAVEEVEDTPAPVKRTVKKPEPIVAPTKDVTAVLDDWGSDDE